MTKAVVVAGGAVALYLTLKLLGKAGHALFGSGLETVASKIVAASRALESSLTDALFEDPFAERLAGEAAMELRATAEEPGAYTEDCKKADIQNYKKKPVKVANLQPKGADGDTYSAKKVNRYINRIVLRTWYLDTALKAVLLDRADDMHFMHTAEEIKKQLKGTKMLQVVNLGSGMDTRPWRLSDLPAGLSWFEVDAKDVNNNKRKELGNAGCQFPDSEGTDFAYPLKVATYAQVPADLTDPTWAESLANAGHVATQPTLWIAEGVLQYLEQEDVASLLMKCSKLSAPGSVFWCNTVDERDLENNESLEMEGVEHWGTNLYKQFLSGMPKDRDAFFSTAGWTPTNYVSLVDAALWISKGLVGDFMSVPQDHNTGFLTCTVKT